MRTRILFGVFLSLAAALLVTGIAFAHGHITAGDYDLVIGFHNEPAIQGQINGMDLFVTNTKTNEKVNKLEDTLKAEVIFGSSKKSLSLEPQEDQDGAYIAYFIPSETGDYTYHITGTINGTPVDVSMSSSPDTFNSVASQASFLFPGADPAGSSSSANIGLYVGLGSGVLAIVALGMAWLAFQAARAKKS